MTRRGWHPILTGDRKHGIAATRWGERVILVLFVALLIARFVGYQWSWAMLVGPTVAMLGVLVAPRILVGILRTIT